MYTCVYACGSITILSSARTLIDYISVKTIYTFLVKSKYVYMCVYLQAMHYGPNKT